MADNWQLKAVISANAAGMLSTLKAVNAATRTTRKYILDVAKSGGNLAGQLGMPLGLISGALGAFSIAGIKRAVTGFAELGDEVTKSAQRIGISAAEYQRLKYVAGQSGVSVEGLASSMGRLNKGVALAAAGKNKDLASLFSRAGISMRDANGNLRSSADMLPEIAKLFSRNTNAAVQARMGNAIFGKSWQELAPLLQGGEEGIAELTRRYKELGLEVDGKALKAGEAFGDQMDDLKQVVASYGNTISSKLIPLFSPLLEKTIQWATANRELITTNVSKFIADMATEMAKVDWAAIVRGVGDLVNGIKEFVNWIGGAKNALIALVVFMNIGAITATVSLLGSIGRLGFGFAGLAGKALGSIVPMKSVIDGLKGADFSAGNLTSTFGKLGAAIGVVGAAYAGWQIGSLMNDGINAAMEKMTGTEGQTLGGWIYDKTHSERPSLVGPQSKGRVEGEVNININGLPQGSQVEQVSRGGDMPLNLNAGYRGFALEHG